MLESLVSTLLNRILGAYVSNVNYNQLQIGIWSGDVVLRNLKLKKEALDKLDLPVDVIAGHLGELTLNIPWSNLKSKPVMVYIRDVYVLAGPRSESTITAEELRERQYQQKMRKLANAELMKSTTHSSDSAESAKNETFANQLLTKILNNLQFSITNIHVRYEDNISAPGHRFAAGITLNELSAISTDENWIPQNIGDAVATIHKLATLESLSIYWNTDSRSLADLDEDQANLIFKEMIATKAHIPSEHQYVLKPVSGTGRIKLNKNFGGQVPKVDATLLFDELAFVIDDEQYRDGILMIDLFHSYLKKQKYIDFHPPPGTTPKSHPREYFQFAAKAVLSEIHERNYRWTWDHFRQRRDDRLAYIECYVASKLNRASPEQMEKLDALEHKLSYEDLRFYRSLAKNKLRREKAIIAAEEERRKKELAAAQPATKVGWLSSWWYGTSSQNTPAEEPDSGLVITEEQKQEFYDAIEYDEDKAAVAAAVDFPKDTMMLCLRTTLSKGSFTIKRAPHSESPTEVVSLVFDTVMLGFIQYVESFKASAGLGDMRLYDGITKNTQYRQLIGAKQKKEEKALQSKRRSNADPQLLKYSNIQDPFFSVAFEHKPLDGRADNAVALVMRNIDIVYNPTIIREVLDFFRPPETSADSINALIEVAGDTFEDLKNQTKVNLEFALEHRTTLDLKVDMDAPVIVIPEDCMVKGSRGIVLDAGHINVESNLASPEIVQEMKAKRASEYTSEDYMRLRSLMYDKFSVHLTQTKILIGDSVEVCLDQIRNPRDEYNYLHLVERIDMSFLVELCILRNSVDLANIKISGHLPLLAVNFSDTKYRMLMQIPRLIEASGILRDNDQSALSTGPAADASKSKQTSDLMRTRLWKQTEEEFLLDSDSEDSDELSDDAGSLTGVGDGTMTAATSSVVSRKSTDGKNTVSAHQKIFELDFRVDRVSANILEANVVDGRASEDLLCDLVLQHLAVGYCLRPHDTAIYVSLKSLDVADRVKHGNEFKYLVTSDQDVLQTGGNISEAEAKDLVNVEYIRVDRMHPEYLDKYKGIDQTANITLSTLNFIITRSSILTLYNFVLNTFVDEDTAATRTKRVTSLEGATVPTSQSVSQRQQDVEQSIHVSVLLDSVNFILNNDGVRLATGELSHGDLTALIANGTTRVSANFANFTLTDDLSPVKKEPGVQQKPYGRQLLTIQGEELIDFRFETFKKEDADYPGYDQSIYLRMGSAQFTFLEEPVQQFLEYLGRFAAMKTVYDRARQAALESAQQFQQSVAKTHFDVIIETPVVLFPEMHQHPLDVVVAHLGEIWASNSFIDEKDGCINLCKAGIRAISLTSKYYHQEKPGEQLHLQTLPIIDNIDFDFNISSIHDGQFSDRPDIEITGKVTDIQMHLTDRQYTFLMDAINMISRVWSGSQDAGDTANALSPPPLPARNKGEPTIYKGSSKDQPKEEREPGLPRIKLCLTSKTIGLDIYKNQSMNSDPLAVQSLSRIALNDTRVQYIMHKNDTMTVSVKVTSLTVDDTRPDVKSQFKEIIPATENGHQFELQLDISAPQPARHGIATIIVTEPKIVLSLDHAFLLYDFFIQPFGPKPDNAEKSRGPSVSYRSSSMQSKDNNGMEISFRINIVNPEFILLENPDAMDSEAVVLSANQVMISRQAVTALAVRQVGMYLCRMDMRQTSTLKFIQSFDVSMSMNNNNTSSNTELEVDVEALILRLSYRDAMLVTDIFNKAYILYNETIQNTPSSTAAQQQPNIEVQEIVTSVGNRLMRESLRASFQGLKVVLIEDIHEMPMIDINIKPFSVEVANWSRSLSADVSFSAYVNFFNVKNSHWEPLIEPWSFKLAVTRRSTQKNEPLNVKLLSNSELNVNITHTFLESALATMRWWDKQKELAYKGERGTIAPYRLRNWTGYRLHLWNANNGATPGETVIKTLEDGAEMPWWFEDWRERRETITTTNNMLSIQLDGALWESLRNVSVDSQGEHIYSLRPRIDGVQHRVVFDVKLVDNVKVVTIRSSVLIENRTLLPVDIALLDRSGQRLEGPIKKIAPGEDFALPIEKAFHNRFIVRPDAGFGYTWTDRGLHWKDFVKNGERLNTIKCLAKEGGDMPPFVFQIYGRMDKKNVLFGHYPIMAIRLSAPIEIENLLPYSFNFRIIDKTAGQDFSSYLRKGGNTPLHVIENGHLLLFNIQMPDTSYSASEFAIISTRGTEDLNIDESLQLVNRDNVKLTLRINITDIPESGGARKYSIYCPYVMINKTGRAISVKARPAWQSSMFSGGQNTATCRIGDKPEPYMFSYPKLDNRNRSLIQVSGTDWSPPLSFEAVGSVHDVALPKVADSEDVHLGISVQEGQGKYKMTKIVTFMPRFVLSNQMDESIRYREPESRADHVLEPKQRVPLYNLRKNAEKQLSVKLPGINNAWSAPFNIQDIGTVHVRLDSADGSTVALMRVTTVLEEATIFIVLRKEKEDAWPYRIVNETDEDMTFYQEDPVVLRDDYVDSRLRHHRTKRYRLPAHQSVPYSWDMPAIKDKKIILNAYGRERSINLQEIGSQLPFRHSGKNGRQVITSIDIKTHQSTQVVYLKPYNQADSYYRLLTSESSISAASSRETVLREGFETVDVKPVINFVVEVQLSQIGFSMVNRHLQEIAYITFRGFELKLTDSNMYQSLRWLIKWVQIDNQLYGTMFPILLYPTNVTKEGGNQEIVPTFQLGLDRVKDDSHGVLYFKYFSILLQEMSVEMDEAFIYAILDFTHLDVEGWNAPVDDGKIWEISTEIPDVKPQDGVAQLYFEMLSIQPIEFDLSFVRTDQVNIVDERAQGNSALTFFVNVLTMAIGNINAAPLRFNALAVENLRASGLDLLNRIFIHYSDQFVYQFHRMLGSADFLGNPVGLFNNLSSGVAELFYEPWQGFIYSDRPHDLGIGIARGFSGFLRKSVFGVSDSFTKFTGSISKGLSAATMDREYQERRRMNMARNRPRHALGGVAQGANSLASGLASGMAGLVTRPIEGASKEGVGGFFTGVGKGLVGAVTKPVVGVFDLASNVTEGIRNSATPSDTNDIERIRPPRYIGPDGILRPYSAREAQGQNWLKDVDGGKYFNDVYIAHCHVQSNERVAMLTSNRLMLIRTRRLAVEWQEPFTEIQTIKCEPTGIAIYLRSMSWEPFLVIPDKTNREAFFKKIEEAVIKYNAARRPSD